MSTTRARCGSRSSRASAQEEFRQTEQAGTGAAARIKSAWDSVATAWVGIVAGIMAMREAWDLMNIAAKAEQQERSFASLAASYGTNGDKIIADLKRVSAGTIDTMTMIKNAGTAMMMGIAPDDVVKLLEIARATAKMTGQDTVKAFEDISLAVGRQSKMILDNLGIILDVEKANEEYAKSLGKTALQLTDLERKQAFMSATLKAGGELMDKLGRQSDTVADKLERLKATFENIRVAVGGGLIKAFLFLEGDVRRCGGWSSGSIRRHLQNYRGRWQPHRQAADDQRRGAEWKLNAEAAFGAAEDLARKSDQAFKDIQGLQLRADQRDGRLSHEDQSGDKIPGGAGEGPTEDHRQAENPRPKNRPRPNGRCTKRPVSAPTSISPPRPPNWCRRRSGGKSRG